MVIKNKLMKLSSLCFIGAISIAINQLVPANAKLLIFPEDSGSTGEDKVIEGQMNLNAEYAKDETKAPVRTISVATVAPPLPTKNIKGIDYMSYVDLKKFQNIAIANVTDYLNIREGAGMNYDVIGKMPPYSGCTIVKTVTNSKKEVWCKISSGDVTGYVMKDLLVVGEGALKLIPSVGNLVAKANCDVLNVRADRSTKADILYQINKNEALNIIGVTDGWIEVDVALDENSAFISSDYVTISFELDKAIEVDEALNGYSEDISDLVSYAKQFLGDPYVYGGNNLKTGVDCSGYVQAIFAHFGYHLQRSSREQAKFDGVEVSYKNLRPGDLVFYSSGGVVSHVAIYIGNNYIIHASNPRSGIKISSLFYANPTKYKRILN